MSIATAVRAGRAYVELYADHTKLDKGLRRAQAKLRSMGRAVNRMGTQMIAGGAAIAAPLAIATKVFSGFDDQMRTVQAVLGATGQQFEKLTAKAKELGRTTSYTAAQVAGGMVELARAGFDADQIDASIESMLALSRATGTELAEATGIAGNTLRQFSLEADQAGRVADVLTATANNSAQTLSDLGESMKYAGPVADEYGLSLEQTAKSLGALANFGIKGSMAGTTMKNILLQMADPAIRAELEAMGVSVTDAQGNLRDIASVLREVGKATEKLPNAQRLAIFDKLFGRRAVAGGAKLTVAEFDKLNAAIDNAAGTAKRAAEGMDAGIGGTLRRLWSAIEGTAIAVGNALAPALEKAGERLTEIVGKVTAWVGRNREAVVFALKLAGGLLTLGVALKGVAAVLGLAASAVGVLKGALTLLMLHPVVAAVGLLAAGIGYLAYRSAKAAAELRAMEDAARAVREQGQKQRTEDMARLSRLDELSKKEKLNNTEKAEAKRLAKELSKTYGDLGIEIDTVTGKIGGMAKAMRDVMALMQKSARDEVRGQIDVVKEQLRQAREAVASAHTMYGTEPVGNAQWMKDLDAARKRVETLMRKLGGLAQALQRINEGEVDVLPDAEKGKPGAPAALAPLPRQDPLKDRRKLLHEILQLEINKIADEERREITSLELRYMERIRLARKAGQDVNLIEKALELEKDAIHRKHAEKRAEQERQIAQKNRDMRWQIAELELDAGGFGSDQREALRMQLEYAKALESARSEGLDTSLVDRIFALRDQLAKMDIDRRISTQARGSFAVGAFADALGSGSSSDRIARATEATAKNTKTLIVEVKRKAGLQP